MKLSSLIASRPISFFILLAFSVLLLPSLMIPHWCKMTKRIESYVELSTQNFHSVLLSEIESTAKLLHPINTSATNLARVLSSSLNQREPSFFEVESKVAPLLFQAFSITPYISQISYIGIGGIFFSYFIDGNQTIAVYSNSSFSSNARNKYNWYTQPVNRDTGMLYGEVVIYPQWNIVNTSWFLGALNSTYGYASLEPGWNGARDLLFHNTASVHGNGVVALGFSMKALVDFFTSLDFHGGSFYLATSEGKVLVEGLPYTQMVLANNSISFQLLKQNDDQTGLVKTVACTPSNGTLRAYNILDMGEAMYKVYCSPIDIVGVQSVYALTLPLKGSDILVHQTSKFALTLLIIMVVIMVISIFSFVFLMMRAAQGEMHLHVALIKQMEATQQAERKCVNKSVAFASASHDIRAALAGITGLIEICYEEVAHRSDLETNLKQMEGCTKDLVGLLNSILDTSKIEAGKMQLDEEEFNMAQLLEDVVDLYHPVGMKKGVDVVLDPFDGSILRYSHVKGDRGKLKQILCNLLSNAVKFTSDGHVTVTAWARRPKFENSLLSSNQNGNLLIKYFSCLFHKNKEARRDLEAVNAIRQYPNAMQFIFEVEDTGKGIPKDKRESVFENFVQVKETSLGLGGTGLGLGIVQSLVRLMGGEIGIVDKEIGKRGTCFRFNVYLTACETSSTDSTRGEVELGGDSMTGSTPQPAGLTIRAPTPSMRFMCSPSSRLNIHSPKVSPKLERSHVVLLIENEERRRISHKYMENLGINVSVVTQWEHLSSTLKKLKSNMNCNHTSHGSSGKSDVSWQSDHSSGPSLKDVPLSVIDGTDQRLPFHKRKGAPAGFILILIDATAGPFPELYRVVTDFKRGLHSTCCKVVWLDKPTSRSINLRGLEEEKLDSSDDILLKPFHGSRLYQVIKLLPEFGGALQHGILAKSKRESTIQGGKLSKSSSSSSAKNSPIGSRKGGNPQPRRHPHQQGEIQEVDSSSDEECRSKVLLPSAIETHGCSKSRNFPTQVNSPQRAEIQEESNDLASDKPLRGKRVLIADDVNVLRKIAEYNLKLLGATFEVCKNGEEALELVRNGLRGQNAPYSPPFDYILMDCEMPIMDGYEATRLIRIEEKHYSVRIPIIAVTAHTSGEEVNKTIEAGMDVHLAKPINKEKLMKAIREIHMEMKFV
ncbi:Response_reg domain-containing protein/HisKA domain-containing protein/HATPase_c domain-containing protein [Cephalotus follicularis]|uniref:histidine kinase n=1 Tax=Cephalotus follicularis TaxID=3775 RepID=A0A1Q3CTM5_CEPFO|nr:Response_reg domain-containing protein/HisKA domain-containing protein/HATPase_c domain-containing protein [Cephalotus follicularis]